MPDPSCLGVVGGRSKFPKSCSSTWPRTIGSIVKPKANGFGMQPDPRLLGPQFKRGLKLLSLVFSQTHLNLSKFIVIVINHFWIIIKFISFFFQKKTNRNSVVLNHIVLLLPLHAQRQGRRRFLKSFFLAHSLPRLDTTYTHHTLPT